MPSPVSQDNGRTRTFPSHSCTSSAISDICTLSPAVSTRRSDLFRSTSVQSASAGQCSLLRVDFPPSSSSADSPIPSRVSCDRMSFTSCTCFVPAAASSTSTLTSAIDHCSAALRIPSFSMSSPTATLSPAVSDTEISRPNKSMRTSNTSLVVPGVALVMAAGRLAIAFSKELFPAFGGPARTMRRPSLKISPHLASSRNALSSRARPLASSTTLLRTSSWISSSSPKSMKASTCARLRTNFDRHDSYSCDVWPPICRSASFLCVSVPAASKSASPSASTRSILPLSRALRENSPACAGRSPSIFASASETACTTAVLPCRCSSATSSPVKLLGEGNHKTIPRSRRIPVTGCSRLQTAACLAAGNFLFVIMRKAAPASGPDKRMTETPPRPGGDERAKIVSSVAPPKAYLFRARQGRAV
mmetsp:Transcript_48789/g.118438  ORF Transcript_48789/g.118438 Transcript_48789/m.118438 type:complete len:419 (+) Transcript_48789:473-1729(+)